MVDGRLASTGPTRREMRIERIVRLAIKGLDAGEIATATGVPEATVSQICRRRGFRIAAHRPRKNAEDSLFPDHCSADGAGDLAKRLVEHWRELGFAVKAWPEMVDGHWTVRSDTVNGLPVKRLDGVRLVDIVADEYRRGRRRRDAVAIRLSASRAA